ncbi:uncharacterized protein EDB91DRAFT_1332863 [Suillus paluster]|uniref:uncharacterized protein n=1 Tax=Suillus paluster TaxID=48578 RepID=UPI001B87FD64|nr:uncharacterized protein EDB91DRAFT_1332863 [Suillus paluster]KAG1755115.1 hypothetical protein EDB91DRAFT_1332863 [Suillus paluster]
MFLNPALGPLISAQLRSALNSEGSKGISPPTSGAYSHDPTFYSDQKNDINITEPVLTSNTLVRPVLLDQKMLLGTVSLFSAVRAIGVLVILYRSISHQSLSMASDALVAYKRLREAKSNAVGQRTRVRDQAKERLSELVESKGRATTIKKDRSKLIERVECNGHKSGRGFVLVNWLAPGGNGIESSPANFQSRKEVIVECNAEKACTAYPFVLASVHVVCLQAEDVKGYLFISLPKRIPLFTSEPVIIILSTSMGDP